MKRIKNVNNPTGLNHEIHLISCILMLNPVGPTCTLQRVCIYSDPEGSRHEVYPGVVEYEINMSSTVGLIPDIGEESAHRLMSGTPISSLSPLYVGETI